MGNAVKGFFRRKIFIPTLLCKAGFLLAALFGTTPASALTCNSPSGFIQSFGTFNTGDLIVFGPDCVHVEDGGAYGLNLSLNSLTIGTATLNAPNGDNVWQQTGTGNNASTAYHLNPGTGTLPTGTISEFVAQATNSQAFGGNYGRWSFGVLGSIGGFSSGIFGEYGGTTATGQMGPFEVQNAVENPPGTFTVQNFFRLNTTAGAAVDSELGSIGFGVGDTAPIDKIVLTMAAPSGAGAVNSHSILYEGGWNTGSVAGHTFWREFENITSNSGASTFLWQSNLNGAGFNTRLSLTDSGVLNAATIIAQAGNGASSVRLAGLLSTQLTATGNGADLTEDTLQTYTMPANTFDVTGRCIRVEGFGNFGANADVKTIRLYFGSANIYTSTGLTQNGTGWYIWATICKNGSNLQTFGAGGTDGNNLPGTFSGAMNQTDSGSIIIKITGQTGTANANDIIANGMTVTMFN